MLNCQSSLHLYYTIHFIRSQDVFKTLFKKFLVQPQGVEPCVRAYKARPQYRRGQAAYKIESSDIVAALSDDLMLHGNA